MRSVMTTLLQIHCKVTQYMNFENRTTYGERTGKEYGDFLL